jgi:hypothetical protein
MARVTITPTPGTGQYPTAGVALTEVACDPVNFNQFVASGRDLLIARNTDVGAQTVTLRSVADDKGRTGDITAESIPAGGLHIFGPLAKSYWAQANGFINVDGASANIKFSVVQIP